MSVAGLAYERPRVRFSVLDGFQGVTPAELERRLVFFEFEDHDRKADKVTMKFENADGLLLEPFRIAIGVALQTTFGYPGAEQSRLCVIRRIRGLVQRPRGASSTGRQGDLGLATFEGFGRLMDLNLMAAPATGPFRNVTRADAVALVARKYLRGRFDIEDDGQVFEEIPVKANETDGQFIKRLANDMKYTVALNDQEFFFRRRKADPIAPEEIDYRLSPDVVSWEVDLDLTIPIPDLIEAKTWDARRRLFEFHQATTPTGEEVRAVAGDALAAPAGSSETPVAVGVGYVGATQRAALASREVVHVPHAQKQIDAATRRLEAKIERRTKLTLTLVGNPRLRAGRNVKLGNFGTFVDGVWYIKQCTHRIDAQGVYVTIVKLVGDAPKDGGIAVREHRDFSLAQGGDTTVAGSGYIQLYR